MGYTHYWDTKAKVSKANWNKAIVDIKKVVKASDVEIAFELDQIDIEPIFSEELIRFNGIEDDGHETFAVKRVSTKSDWNFCKTARKPYDILVCSCLLLLKHHKCLKGVTSDGSAKVEYDIPVDPVWELAVSLVKYTTDIDTSEILKTL